MEKRLLLLCRDRNAKILNILGEQEAGEVMEFQTTIQMVQVVVNRLLNGKKQIIIDVPLLDKIYTVLGEYQDMLEEYIASGRLRRLLNSNRMRRKLEKLNSDLHVHLKSFVEVLKEMNTGANAAAGAIKASLATPLNGNRATGSASATAPPNSETSPRELKVPPPPNIKIHTVREWRVERLLQACQIVLVGHGLSLSSESYLYLVV